MRLDMQRLSNEWEAIERGIDGAIGFLDEEHIFDRHRLPTVVVVPVLASIWSQMPQSLDAHGQARTLLRQYLWRSFFTERYERAAATAALQDHRGLKARLVDGEWKGLPGRDFATHSPVEYWPFPSEAVAEISPMAHRPTGSLYPDGTRSYLDSST